MKGVKPSPKQQMFLQTMGSGPGLACASESNRQWHTEKRGVHGKSPLVEHQTWQGRTGEQVQQVWEEEAEKRAPWVEDLEESELGT